MLNHHSVCFSRCLHRSTVHVLRFYAEKYKSNYRLKSANLENVTWFSSGSRNIGKEMMEWPVGKRKEEREKGRKT